MRTTLTQVLAILILGIGCQFASAERRMEVLTDGWRFAPGPQELGAAKDLDDSSWRQVRVPHDWAIAGPPQVDGDGDTGKLPWRGEGWYRRRVKIPAEDSSRRVYLLFDGVMASPTVYINGEKAGSWDYGYNSFWVDATQHIKFGEENLIAVHADNTRHRSRWYPGAGIYRKVTLHVLEPIHAENWGTRVTSSVSDSKEATVTVRSEIRNHLTTPQDIQAEFALIAPGEENVLSDPVKKNKTIPAQGAVVVEHKFKVKDFKPWGLRSPNLYSARLRVLKGEEEVDRTVTPFGIRQIEFTPKYGFYLNGKRVQLRGVNLHHDLGPLGAAFHPRALQRQLEIMKDMGVNAIRTSHNAPAPELLEMCDEMGLLVFNELFDKWDDTADLHDQEQFEPFMRRNVANFVRRDRNHPSVITWSIGNEIGDVQRFKDGENKQKVAFMVDLFKQHDDSRPVTMGCNIPGVLDHDILDALDITSWNYGRKYAKAHERYPEKPTIYSESASALSTRGYYHLPHPGKKTEYATEDRQVDSYDWNAATWSDIADVEFARMEADRYCSGEFVWTGIDYLGEPTPFNDQWAKEQGDPQQSARSSYFGAVDLCGIPKDRYYLYRSHWAPQKITIHILPHWNWPGREGQPTPVYVYTSGDEAELFLNGKSLGRRKKETGKVNPDAKPDELMNRYRLRWEDVAYEPGELTAVAYLKGKEIGSATVRTAEAPKKIRLQAEHKSMQGDGQDLTFVLVEMVDAAGTLCPLSDAEVTFTVSGPAQIVGVGNGDPLSMASFTGDRVKLFHGKAMVYLRSLAGGKGPVKLTAKSEGVADDTVEIIVSE